eukprot:1160395-Prorocentrum_minimum.AAC.1
MVGHPAGPPRGHFGSGVAPNSPHHRIGVHYGQDLHLGQELQRELVRLRAGLQGKGVHRGSTGGCEGVAAGARGGPEGVLRGS